MQIKVLDSGKNFIEFKLKEERHTFPQLLKHYLLKEPSVEFCSYKLDHPLEKDAKFFVRVKSGKPSKALRDANKAIIEDAKEFKKKTDEAFK